jgi:hypothetical protein
MILGYTLGVTETKACPACAEPVAAAAIKCKWCGETFAPAGTPSNDEEHLRLLSICHYVSGALTAFFSCVPLIHVAIGLGVFLGTSGDASSNAPPPWFGLIFVVLGGAFVLAGWTLAIAKFVAGRSLARRRRRSFCVVVACVCCVLPPIGTVLGVFTLIVLNRPSVKALFARGGLAR